MADNQYQLYLWALGIIGAGFIVAYYTRTLSSNTWLYVGAILVVSTGSYLFSKSEYYSKFKDQLDTPRQQSQDFDDMWSDLQGWAQRDPRDTELQWNPSESFFAATELSSYDKETVRPAVLQVKEARSDDPVLICVEQNTGSIVYYEPGAERSNDAPLEHIPFIRDLRRRQHYMSSEDVQRLIRSQSVGRLPGRYSVPMQGTPSGGDEQSETDSSAAS